MSERDTPRNTNERIVYWALMLLTLVPREMRQAACLAILEMER